MALDRLEMRLLHLGMRRLVLLWWHKLRLMEHSLLFDRRERSLRRLNLIGLRKLDRITRQLLDLGGHLLELRSRSDWLWLPIGRLPLINWRLLDGYGGRACGLVVLARSQGLITNLLEARVCSSKRIGADHLL